MSKLSELGLGCLVAAIGAPIALAGLAYFSATSLISSIVDGSPEQIASKITFDVTHISRAKQDGKLYDTLTLALGSSNWLPHEVQYELTFQAVGYECSGSVRNGQIISYNVRRMKIFDPKVVEIKPGFQESNVRIESPRPECARVEKPDNIGMKVFTVDSRRID